MRLAAYFRKNLRDFEILCFTEKQCFLDFTATNISDIMLAAIDAGEAELYDNQTKLIILSDIREKQKEGYNLIYKYQSAKTILQKIEKLISCRCDNKKQNLNKASLYIGMYRPYGGSGIEVCLEAARMLSVFGRCLLISFEEFSNMKRYMEISSSGDLSDAIYYFRQEMFTENILDKTVICFENLDVLMPMENPVDLYCESTEELKSILACIEAMRRYDCILMDMGAVAGSRLELLAECEIIIAVADNDMEGKVRCLSEFLQNVLKVNTEISVFGTLELISGESENRLTDMVKAYFKGDCYEG